MIKIGEGAPELGELTSKLDVPTSSWHDITKDLESSRLIIMRRKNRLVGGIIVYMVYEIQLTKAGLEFLTRFRRA